MLTRRLVTEKFCASGLVVKFNVAIVEPRVRFSAGACVFFSPPFFCILKAPRHSYAFLLVDRCSWNAQGSFLSLKAAFDTNKKLSCVFSFGGLSANVIRSVRGGGTFVIRRRALAECWGFRNNAHIEIFCRFSPQQPIHQRKPQNEQQVPLK